VFVDKKDQDGYSIKVTVLYWQQLIIMIRFHRVSKGFTQNETLSPKMKPSISRGRSASYRIAIPAYHSATPNPANRKCSDQ